MPYLPFILGVDIGCLVGFHQVVRADQAAVGDEFPCFPLRFAQIGAVAAAIGEGGDFDVIERDIALLPERTPQPDHVGKADGIVLILVYVRFTLIPQEATDGIPRNRVQHGIVHHHRAQPVGRSLDAFFRQVDIGIGFQYLAVRPTLDARPAPRAVDDADGYVQHVGEQFGKEITRGGEIGRGLHRTWPPFPRNPILGRIGRREGYFHVAEPVAHTPRTGYDLVGPGDGTVIEPAERHLHIALPAGEPDFADQYVVEYDPLAACDRYLLRLITAGRVSTRADQRPSASLRTVHSAPHEVSIRTVARGSAQPQRRHWAFCWSTMSLPMISGSSTLAAAPHAAARQIRDKMSFFISVRYQFISRKFTFFRQPGIPRVHKNNPAVNIGIEFFRKFLSENLVYFTNYFIFTIDL